MTGLWLSIGVIYQWFNSQRSHTTLPITVLLIYSCTASPGSCSWGRGWSRQQISRFLKPVLNILLHFLYVIQWWNFLKLKSLRLHTVYSALHSSSLELRRFQQVPNFAISVLGSSCQYLFNVHACFFAFFFYSPAFPIKARMPINRLRKKRRENEINKKVLPRKQNEHDHLVPGNTIWEGPSQEILYLTLGFKFFYSFIMRNKRRDHSLLYSI